MPESAKYAAAPATAIITTTATANTAVAMPLDDERKWSPSLRYQYISCSVNPKELGAVTDKQPIPSPQRGVQPSYKLTVLGPLPWNCASSSSPLSAEGEKREIAVTPCLR